MQASAIQIESILEQLSRAVQQLDPRDYPFFIGSLEQLKVMAWSRLTALQANPRPPESNLRQHYLTVPEAAERFRVTRKWLYKHKKELPHIQPSRKHLLFPEEPFTRAMAARKQHD